MSLAGFKVWSKGVLDEESSQLGLAFPLLFKGLLAS